MARKGYPGGALGKRRAHFPSEPIWVTRDHLGVNYLRMHGVRDSAKSVTPGPGTVWHRISRQPRSQGCSRQTAGVMSPGMGAGYVRPSLSRDLERVNIVRYTTKPCIVAIGQQPSCLVSKPAPRIIARSRYPLVICGPSTNAVLHQMLLNRIRLTSRTRATIDVTRFSRRRNVFK